MVKNVEFCTRKIGHLHKGMIKRISLKPIHMRNKSNLLVTFLISVVFTLGSCKKEKSALLADHLLEIKEKKELEAKATQTLVNNTVNSDNKALENKVTTKSYYKKEDNYVIDYRYPVLDTKQNPAFKVFNDFITDQYLDYKLSVKDIINKQKLSCQIGYDKTERFKRLVDYKVYANNPKVLSVLLYKANHYTKENQYSYLFKTLNFDPAKGAFISFESMFRVGAEKEVFKLVSKALKEKIENDDHYQQCQELKYDTFLTYKDNFVIDKSTIKFYFDDCVICPVYSGNYFVEIPRSSILDVLNTGF